jgi:hypothetical protein
MTKGWTQKQQQERSSDTRHVNKLSDKKLDFAVVSDQDREASYQVQTSDIRVPM